ncbi:MAG: hypothetical protein Kow0090_07710 [Myxococcota bacterium]
MKRVVFNLFVCLSFGTLFPACSSGAGSGRESIYYSRHGERAIECSDASGKGISFENGDIMLGSKADMALKALFLRNFKDVSKAKLKGGFTLYTVSRKRFDNRAASSAPTETINLIADSEGKIVSIGWSESFGYACHPPLILTDDGCENMMKNARISESGDGRRDKSFSFIFNDDKRGDFFVVQNRVELAGSRLNVCELDIANAKEALKGVMNKR